MKKYVNILIDKNMEFYYEGGNSLGKIVLEKIIKASPWA
jgi:hypothetical protein